jgi:hypothetical protein
LPAPSKQRLLTPLLLQRLIQLDDDELVIILMTGSQAATEAERVVVIVQDANCLVVKEHDVLHIGKLLTWALI